MMKAIRKFFRIKWYTGNDCHHCGRQISENHNQATALNGRYTMRTICKPCHIEHCRTVQGAIQ